MTMCPKKMIFVVSDHAENLGLAPMIAESNAKLLENPWGRDIHDLVKAGKGREAFTKWGREAMLPLQDPIDDPELYGAIWQRLTPAWPAYDQKYFGVEIPDNVPKVVQNRAYTSPVWYTPNSQRTGS